MRPVVVALGPFTAASANSIATSQTPSSGVPLTLTANPVIVDATAIARRVVVTAGSEASQRQLVVTGTDRYGHYSTAVSIIPNSTFTAAITVGTIATGTTGAPDVGSSAFVRLDDFGFGSLSFAVDVALAGGSISWTVDQSDDDPNVNLTTGITAMTPLLALSAMSWVSPPDATFAGAAFTNGSTSKAGSMLARPAWLRLSATAVTGGASATLTVSQAGGRGG